MTEISFTAAEWLAKLRADTFARLRKELPDPKTCRFMDVCVADMTRDELLVVVGFCMERYMDRLTSLGLTHPVNP